MTDEGHSAQPPSKKALGLITLAALGVGVALTTLFVLPAEYGIDPTGFGKVTGLAKLAPSAATPTPVAAATYPAVAWRNDVLEIALKAAGDAHHEDELEYKVRMKPGDTMTYAWSVPVANPEEFYFDFHGETPAAKEGDEPVVMEYKQATGTSSSGALTAPIAGIHGWYFQNQSEKPVTVRLQLSGFYELVPPGEYGNEYGFEPVAPAPSPANAAPK